MKRMFLASATLVMVGLSGCQSSGTQFANPFSNREVAAPNAMPGMMPASPAFSRVQAGQNLPMMAQGYPQGQPMMMPQGQPMMMAQQPIIGSGGMVYPVGYQQGQPMMAQPGVYPQGQPMMMAQPGVYPQGQPGMAYPPAAGPATVYTPNAPVMHAPPPALPASTPNVTPGVTTIQGPNGPITVTTEILDQPPTLQTNPTFTPPAPVTIPLPEPANLPQVNRQPEVLPPSVGTKGPMLPGLTNPAAVSFPAVPVGHQQPVVMPKIPAPTAPSTSTEDDIPAAPISFPSR